MSLFISVHLNLKFKNRELDYCRHPLLLLGGFYFFFILYISAIKSIMQRITRLLKKFKIYVLQA